MQEQEQSQKLKDRDRCEDQMTEQFAQTVEAFENNRRGTEFKERSAFETRNSSSRVEFGKKGHSLLGSDGLHERATRLLELKTVLLNRYSAKSLTGLPVAVQEDFAMAAQRAGLTLLARDWAGDVDVDVPERVKSGESEEQAT
jgi:hypothetical protein